MGEDLEYPRINILYTSKRIRDAQAIYLKYTNLGARVTLFEVKDDLLTKKHLGKLYYFDDSPRFKEIANYMKTGHNSIPLKTAIAKFRKLS